MRDFKIVEASINLSEKRSPVPAFSSKVGEGERTECVWVHGFKARIASGNSPMTLFPLRGARESPSPPLEERVGERRPQLWRWV
jgi:hypothetical protein